MRSEREAECLPEVVGRLLGVELDARSMLNLHDDMAVQRAIPSIRRLRLLNLWLEVRGDELVGEVGIKELAGSGNVLEELLQVSEETIHRIHKRLAIPFIALVGVDGKEEPRSYKLGDLRRHFF